ncbi:MAG: HNH endonuclease family protein, partial [Gammaproteobacteria bacterium]|nr:HNH endonuclease family protein [Gammaproteobacteria bacterium]
DEVAHALESWATRATSGLVRLFSNLPRLGLNPRSIVRTIERFTFLYSAVSRQPINKCEKVYGEHARRLHEAVQVEDEKQRRIAVEKVLADLRQALIALVPAHEVFKDAFMAITYRNTQPARHFVGYILDSINASMLSTNELLIDPNNVNTEHVLPLNPAQGWGLSKKEVAPYVNLLGNLTLVDKRINSEAGNEGLAEKLDVLDKSELPLTKALVGEVRAVGTVWGQAEIQERQARLADIAYDRVWKIT